LPFSLLADRDDHITKFSIIGEPSFQEGMATLLDFYKDNPTKNVMWNLKKASFARISSKQFEEIIESIQPYVEKRKGGKTAVIATKILEHELAKMVQTFIKKRNLPFKFEVFQTIKDAMNWFDEKESYLERTDGFNKSTMITDHQNF
jgi:hypothetical protein